MKHSLALLLLATAIASPGAAQMMGSSMGPPPSAGANDMSRFNRTGMNTTPVVSYDPATHERITYSLSRETGGFIEGVNTETHKAWHADVRADRSMTGKDADGAAWKYDHHTKTYTNLATGRTCVSANLRHVCGS
jgi:hypothetical protein